jgi:lipopolysaccharide biosynthesis glycosyltransferase
MMTLPSPPAAVALAVDEGYALPAAVTICSLTENLPRAAAVELVVLDLGLSRSSRARLAAAARPFALSLLPFDVTSVAHLPTSDVEHAKRLSTAMYAYLHLPALVSSRYRRLLYLDADVLVLADVSDLLTSPLDGCAVAAVTDLYVPTAASPESIADHVAQGLAAHTPCLNAGVLLIDVDTWLETDVAGIAIAYAAGHEHLNLPDQNSLNVALRGAWMDLGYAWNFQLYEPLIDAYDGPEPKIVHFSGRHKPWTLGCMFPRYQALYETYQSLLEARMDRERSEGSS